MKKLALSLLALSLAACQSTPNDSGNQALGGLPCTYFGDTSMAAPEWVCSGSIDDARFSYMALGVSDNAAGGVAHQRNLAMLDAQQQIAKELATEVIQVMKTSVGTLGVAGSNGATAATSEETNAMAQQSLKGGQMLRAQKGPDGLFYVLVGLPEQQVEQNVAQMLSAAPVQSELSDAELAAQISAALGN